MADHFLGDVLDPCCDADYAQLEAEYYWQLWGGPFCPPIREYPVTYITCKYCKEEGFRWGKVDGKWRLMDINKREVHACWEKK